ncbi:putative ribonuclease H-like domain-containing protein [Tanacetum coccineum]
MQVQSALYNGHEIVKTIHAPVVVHDLEDTLELAKQKLDAVIVKDFYKKFYNSLEVMEFESAQNNTTAKLPILKLGEYEMWMIRIKQYFQVQDYALWEVIENGNSWVSVPETSQEGSTSVTKMIVPVTAEEKICKKNDVKARSLLLMALPNEHQLTFTTKKTQKALLKQQYENFNASSSESLDSIFNILQKIVSRLTILGVVIIPEDLNSKFFRSLPPGWNTHVVVWMNKADIETLSIDDFTSSTNNVNTANPDVSIVSTNVNTASLKDTTTLSDATVYAFLANQPKGSQLVHEYLKQIHDDDLEEMDLKWQLALLSMRARKFYQRTGRKITINGSDTVGFDKINVECYNCHKMGHFARKCRAPRNKDGQYRYQDNSRNQESSKRTVNVEDTSSKAMLDIDGVGFDWSYIAEEQVQTHIALMEFSDSECDDLIVKLNDTEFKEATYKRGLATIEDQLVTYKKNEVLFCKEIIVLKREVGCKEYELGVLRTELEKVKKEKERIDFKITKFDKSAKDLDEIPTKLDLSYSGLDEFKEPEFNGYGPRDTVLESTKDCSKESNNSKENTDDSVETEQVSEDISSSSDDTCSLFESPLKVDRETVFHSDKKKESFKLKINEKPVKKTVRPYTTQVNTVRANGVNAVKPLACWVWRPTIPNGASLGNPQMYDKGFVDSGCLRHMTGNIAYLSNFKEFDGGHVTFGGGAYGGRISSKGTLKTDSLDFDDVYFVKELNFNIFSVSQMCGKRNYVIFTNSECLVLSPNFKLPDESQILLKIPREDNMYSFDMKNIVPKNSLTCLAAKAIRRINAMA